MTIAWTSPFVPREWIAAHGLVPCRITLLDEAPAPAAMGACSYAAMIPALARRLDAMGFIVCTTCDQMRRAAEAVARDPLCKSSVFVFNVPATWQTPDARQLYRDELQRLGRWLVRLGGTSPTPRRLIDTMIEQDETRMRLCEMQRSMSARSFALCLSHWAMSGHVSSTAEDAPPPSRDATPIGIVGGPLRRDELQLLDCIERAGGRVALDATETGHRGLPRPFDRHAMHESPFEELASAYFDIPDAFRRPDTLLHEYLHRHVTLRGVEGIVLFWRVWCDLWHAQLRRILDVTSVPVIDVQLDAGGDGGSERARTRIESLLEAVR